MAEVKLDLPDGVLEATIQAEILETLSKKPEMVSGVIKGILEARAGDSYSSNRETVLQKTIKGMLKATAEELFGEWLEQNREAIRKALLTYLTKSKSGMLKKIVEQMAKGMCKYTVRVNFGLDEDR